VADAVFLVDNQRYIEKDTSLVNNMSAINRLIAEPFCDVLRAGEQKNTKNIGVRLLDAGDIIQTLGGWTALGYGKSQTASIRLPMNWGHSYRRANSETNKGLQAMDEAVSNLTLECNLEDSASALYLLSAPTKEMTMGLVKELGDHMAELLPKAIIRYGDYPRGGNELKITLIVSQLNHVDKIKEYYDSIPEIIEVQKTRERENESRINEMITASAGVPSLIRGNGDRS
jgi:cell division GTPase FtsZ